MWELTEFEREQQKKKEKTWKKLNKKMRKAHGSWNENYKHDFGPPDEEGWSTCTTPGCGLQVYKKPVMKI